MLFTITIPFFIAGFGMVGAGVLLDIVQVCWAFYFSYLKVSLELFWLLKDWDLYQNIHEIIILVPALLGLKGNLEMTLASRLSTQVNFQSIF